MMLLFRISVQLSVEPLIAQAVCNYQHAWAITGLIYLIIGRIHFDCFDRSVYWHCVLYVVKRD